jgi:hypothetical protein
MKSQMQYDGRLVTVMCIEPNGTWAMVRNNSNTMPFVVRVKELSEPAISMYGDNNAPALCRWCGKPEADHKSTSRHKFLAEPQP